MISVLLCIYKEDISIIQKAISSILNQTYQDFELVAVVDNPEHEVAIKYLLELSKKDKRVKYHVNEKNIGLANALNVGLGLASGEYIARMDADDISMLDRFEKSLSFLNEHNLDLIGGVYEIIDENDNIIPNSMTKSYSKEQTEQILKFTNIVPHPTWFAKKSVFDKLKGYRNIKYAEDYDFLLRALEEDVKIAVFDQKVLNYRRSSEGISRSHLYKQYLMSCYLSHCFGHLSSLNQDYINENAFANYSLKKEKKYTRNASCCRPCRLRRCSP